MGDVARFDTDLELNRSSSVDIVLAAVPRSISSARHEIARLMDTIPQLPTEVAEDVLLLVSELVTNAVLHAGSAVHVAASVEPGRILVAVGDNDPEHAPMQPERGPMATSGRGIRLVDLLASSWGVELFEQSKVVWFESAYETSVIDLRSATH